MKKFFFFLLLPLAWNQVRAQGCVAIRSNGGTCTLTGAHDKGEKASVQKWALGVNNRYFRSFRHFVGKQEQKHRMEQETEVINHAFSTEFSLTHYLNSRWSLALYMPLVSNARSSLYEHNGQQRYSTRSFGLGDIRVAAYYWLLKGSKMSKGNVQLGLGLKLPTGDYRYSDYFHRNDSVKVLGPVDQSIQPGDGGTGITGELNGFYHVGGQTSLYANAFYLLNPREQNGVSTARGNAPSATAIAYGSDVMSVPDQYMLRLGAALKAKQFTFSAGMRLEGIPAEDLVGGSNGFRRPGYVLSLEPVVAYKAGQAQLYLSIPYAVERNRTQSVPDKIRTQKTSVYAQGDAAFADYSINVGITFPL